MFFSAIEKFSAYLQDINIIAADLVDPYAKPFSINVRHDVISPKLPLVAAYCQIFMIRSM